VAYLVKFVLAREGFLTEVEAFAPLVELIAANSRLVDLTAGIVFPLLILSVLEFSGKKEHPGYARVQEFAKDFHEQSPAKPSDLPAKMVTVSLVIIAVLMLGLAAFDRAEAPVLGSLAVVLGAIAGIIHWSIKRKSAAT
jgi:hypothetical protein